MNGITYKEYYDFLYMNTLLMKYEVQVVARMMWNKGIRVNGAQHRAEKSVFKWGIWGMLYWQL